MSDKQPPKVIRIKCEKRGDTYYVSSKDMPGLWLWGKNKNKLTSDIGPTIEYLLEKNYGIKADVVEKKGFWVKRREWISSILPDSKCGNFEVVQSEGRTLTSTHG